MKRVTIVLLALLLCSTMVFAGGGKETVADGAEKNVRLVYAEVNPLDSIVGKTDRKSTRLNSSH